MTDKQTIVEAAAEDGKDHGTRRVILVLALLALLGFATAIIAGWIAWDQKQQQVNARVHGAGQRAREQQHHLHGHLYSRRLYRTGRAGQWVTRTTSTRASRTSWTAP